MEKKQILGLAVDVDAKGAIEQIKELTAAANECVEAFEQLEKKVSNLTSPFLRIRNNLVNDDAIKLAERTLGIREL
ncbi:hypothetical protein [Bacillus sp. AFS019443]|uniref:hypothetical protein n=1 Tax=Bacillus sp. AFS019443 TaxID=2034279 RepID=UPI000BF361F9|nr:hypothetical protein [Bacillus sp. AFS019443]PEU16817.1 hypothetical protein CN524_03570 [Bacillus sp. AFS019443]